ncbi:ubiquitin carboxyl-terminal hydrolase [Trifolium repens]|nr:ubiquitin carboxyl-terminal hydrolase [Trifolium repens]
MLTFTESDDNKSFLIHTSLDPYHRNQNLEIGYEAFLDFYPNKYSDVVPSLSSSSSPPNSVGNKPEPNSDDQPFDDELAWSHSWVRQFEDRMTSRIECDDNESVLTRTNLDSYRQNKTLGTIPEAWKVFYSDGFNKTGTSSSSSSSSKLVGAGIKNMGNTCFMCAILQCSKHISQFVLGIRYCTHSFAPCNDYIYP